MNRCRSMYVRYTKQGIGNRAQRVICIEQDTKNYRTKFIDWYITLYAQNDMHRKMYIKQN